MSANADCLSVIMRMTPSQRTHVHTKCMEKLPLHLSQKVGSLFAMAQRVWQMKRNMNGGKPYEGENLDD